MCSYWGVRLILHGLLTWQIDVFVTPFLCAWVCVCGPTETQKGYTHDWLHNSTPWVGSHLRGQQGSWVCVLIHPFLISPFPLLSPFHVSFCLMQTLLWASYIVRKCPWAQEGGRQEGHRRRWKLCHPTGWMFGSVCDKNGRMRSFDACLHEFLPHSFTHVHAYGPFYSCMEHVHLCMLETLMWFLPYKLNTKPKHTNLGHHQAVFAVAEWTFDRSKLGSNIEEGMTLNPNGDYCLTPGDEWGHNLVHAYVWSSSQSY